MKKGTAPVATAAPINAKVFTFLKELKENNEREWFAENKPRYDADVMASAIAYVTAIQARLSKVSRYLIAEPKKSGGSIMRIYRDTRFSKDKTPYKTNVGIHFRHSIDSDVHAPGFYVHLEPGACFLAGGIWMPAAEPLTAIRQAIAEDTTSWNRVKRSIDSTMKLDGESLKTVPRGFDANHPAIEDLRRKSYMLVVPVTEKQFAAPEIVDLTIDTFIKMKPLMKFLCDALQLPY